MIWIVLDQRSQPRRKKDGSGSLWTERGAGSKQSKCEQWKLGSGSDCSSLVTLQNKEQGAGEEATVKMPPRFLPCRQMTVPREEEQVFGRGKGGFHLGHAEAEMLRNPRWVFSAGNERSIPEAQERVPDEKSKRGTRQQKGGSCR